jgi:1,2-diacylglycerol 3-alpha-glucosyltransferase
MEPEYLQIAKINFGTQYVSRFLWSFARTFSNACDAIVCPTDFVKNDLKRHKFSKPLYICSNGLDIDTSMKRKKDLAAFISQYDLNPEKTALYVGRLSAEKSLDELIESFGLVIKQVLDAKLLIVGDGPLMKDLAALVIKQKLSGKVIFTGQINHQDILDIGIFNAASVFVSCSRSEVQPMSMIEATTFGLPMVVVKARGAGDMVEKNGYVVKAGDKQAFADAVAKILDDKKLQEKLSQQALRFAEKYRVATATQEMVKVYEKVIVKRAV